jgi:hypothetical protein
MTIRLRDRNAEARIQAAIVEWIRTVAPEVIVFAVPNGGLRSKSEAARMKWTGTLAGVPDLVVIGPGGRAYFMEVKAPGGTVSKPQSDMMLHLSVAGSKCRVMKSIDDARTAFKAWGIPTREVVAE